MSAQNDNTAPKGLRGWWAYPPRSGLQRIIFPWEYRHLRGFARVRFAAAFVMVGLGAVTLVGGSFTAKAVGWAAFWLVLAALQFSVAYWLLTIARSASAQA
jgi:hypothetical protein